MADDKKGLVMKRPYYLILFLIISCSSDIEVKIQNSDLGFNSTPLTLQGGLNGVEKVVTLEYTGVNTDPVTACEVSNLSNLTETTTCSCDTEGLCSVGVTPVSSFGGVATFEYKVIAGEVVSNKAKTNIKVKLIEYFAGAISTDDFLGLDVHWNSRTVLLTTSNGNNCIHAVDITSLSSPNLYNTLGTNTSPATSGKGCRSVKIIENGTKFVLPTYDKHTEVWTFGGDSKDSLGWNQLSDLYTSTKQPRRISQFVDNGATYDFVISSIGGLLKASLDKDTNIISITNNATNAYDTSHSLTYQDAVYVNDDLIVATEAGYGKDVKIFASNSGFIKNIELDNASDYMWSSAVSADQTKIAVGGGRLALLSYDGLQADADKVQLEFEVDLNTSMRHMQFFDYQSSSYLAGALGDGSISIYNVDDISTPFLVKNHKISAFDGEAYDLNIIESEEIILVAGTKGKFAILSIPGFF
jgi:hypothetical protein